MDGGCSFFELGVRVLRRVVLWVSRRYVFGTSKRHKEREVRKGRGGEREIERKEELLKKNEKSGEGKK